MLPECIRGFRKDGTPRPLIGQSDCVDCFGPTIDRANALRIETSSTTPTAATTEPSVSTIASRNDNVDQTATAVDHRNEVAVDHRNEDCAEFWGLIADHHVHERFTTDWRTRAEFSKEESIAARGVCGTAFSRASHGRVMEADRTILEGGTMTSHTRIFAMMVLLTCGPVAAFAEETVRRTEDVIYGRKHGMALTMDVFQPANRTVVDCCFSSMAAGCRVNPLR